MQQITVFDDVLTVEEQQLISQQNFGNGEIRWFDTLPSLSSLLEIGNKYFSINPSTIVGYETWFNKTNLGWHKDKDESVWKLTRKEVFPLNTIVYYPLVENLIDGNFVTEGMAITPRTNRMILMSPGILHCVQPFQGNRLALTINPWNRKPFGIP